MSDALVTPPHYDPESTPLPAALVPEDNRFPCPKCDQVWPSESALSGHMSVHTRKRVACPECGKKYVSGAGLGSHRAKVHGVPGARLDKPSNRMAPKIEVEEEITTTAEDVLRGLLAVLFPGGTIPASAVIPLLQWRDDTDKMLKGISGGG